MRSLFKAVGAGVRGILVAVGALAFSTGAYIAVADYTATQGTGITFGSIVVSAKHYMQMLTCDPTTPTQCAAVDASGFLAVKSTTLSTAANQATEISSLATIATNTGAAIPTQASNVSIGGVGVLASTSGGATPSSAIAPATPAGVNLKASAGQVYSIQATTIQATPVFLKLYNSATAPTCGSGTPVMRIMVPAAATAANGAGTNVSIPVGAAFSAGIGYCVTGSLADNDTTAITAANTLINIEWN